MGFIPVFGGKVDVRLKDEGAGVEDTPRRIRRQGGPTEGSASRPRAACPTTIVKTFTVLIIMGNSR